MKLSKGEYLACTLVVIVACAAVWYINGAITEMATQVILKIREDAKERECDGCDEKKRNFIPIEVKDDGNNEG